MIAVPVLYRCPICGNTVELAVRPLEPPTCIGGDRRHHVRNMTPTRRQP